MVITIAAPAAAASASNASNPVRVYLDGVLMTFDTQPQIIGGRTLVPMRAIFTALGATVDWNGAKQTVTATKGDTVIKLVIGNATAVINSVSFKIDQPAVAIGGRTLVPLRFVSDALGVGIVWDGRTRTVNITSAAPGGAKSAIQARVILQGWVNSHAFQLGSELEDKSDVHTAGGVEYYRFYLSITRFGIVEVLVNKETGELFHLESPGNPTFEPLDDWYDRDHKQPPGTGALSENEARAIAQAWLKTHPIKEPDILESQFDNVAFEDEEFFAFYVDSYEMYWFRILVSKSTGEMFAMTRSDGEHPVEETEPLDDWYNRCYG